MPDTLTVAVFATKLGFYTFSLLLAGTAIHKTLGILDLDRYRKLILALVAFSAISLGLRIGFACAQLTGDIQGFFSSDMLVWVWVAHQNMVYVFLAGLIAILAGELQGNRAFLLLGTAFVSASYGLTGHSQALTDPVFEPYAAMLHCLIAAFWLAAPISLWPREDNTQTHSRQTERFSQYAVWLIPVLFISGLLLLLQIAGSFEASYSSPYGRILLGKLFFALLLMGLGAFNKTIITAQLHNAPLKGQRHLRLTLVAETGLFILVLLAITTVTVAVGPPHT